MELALAIMPIVLVLVTGYGLVATKILPTAQWPAIEALSFRLLIPVILLRIIATATFDVTRVGSFALALALTVSLLAALTLCARMLSHDTLGNPSFSTLFQTTTRWNGFVGLAAAELFLGAQGLALIGLAMAILVAPLNILNVLIVSVYGTAKTSVKKVAIGIATNPLILAGLLGLAINLTGQTNPKPIDDTLELIGRAALGVGLLAIGAGISLRRLMRPDWRTLLGVALRPGLSIVVYLTVATTLGLSPEETLAGIFVFGVPAATAGYVVARQMGGNAELYADVMTWQTVLSLILLPAMAIYLLP